MYNSQILLQERAAAEKEKDKTVEVQVDDAIAFRQFSKKASDTGVDEVSKIESVLWSG